MLPAAIRLPDTSIPADADVLLNATCNGLGGVTFRTHDGGHRTYICTGCTACRKVPAVGNRHLDAVAADNAAREARMAAFDRAQADLAAWDEPF